MRRNLASQLPTGGIEARAAPPQTGAALPSRSADLPGMRGDLPSSDRRAGVLPGAGCLQAAIVAVPPKGVAARE